MLAGKLRYVKCYLPRRMSTQVREWGGKPGLSASKAPALYYSCKSWQTVLSSPCCTSLLAEVELPKTRLSLPFGLWTPAAYPTCLLDQPSSSTRTEPHPLAPLVAVLGTTGQPGRQVSSFGLAPSTSRTLPLPVCCGPRVILTSRHLPASLTG